MSHIPTGQTAITPNISVDGGLDAIAFYKRAFGAEVAYQLVMDGRVMHAELRIEGATFTVSDALPEFGIAAPDPAAPPTSSLTIWTKDADALHAQAVAAGASETSSVADQFHGDRVGTVRDPFGHRWIVATHIEDVSPDELQTRMEALFARS